MRITAPAGLHPPALTGPPTLSEEVHHNVDDTYPGWHGWVSRDGDHPGCVYAVAVAENSLDPGAQATVWARTPQLIGHEIEKFRWQREHGVA